jgi:ELWxxDGT repeat protein
MNIRFVAVVAVLVCAISASAIAQAPTLVTTLPSPSGGLSSNPFDFTPVGDAVYFYAEADYDRAGIYKWTEAGGAQLVTGVVREGNGPNVDLIAFGDKLLFSARVDSRGRELWITDGTAAGTTLVKDIYTGGASTPVFLAVSATTAYFTATDPEHGRELWSTDGTEAGTQLVADLTGNSSSSSPGAAIESAGRLYFHALGQLWVSDGTAIGTFALATDVSGTPAGVAGGKVLFLGSDPDHGRELWSTDGTVVGTAMLADLNPGPASSWGGIPTAFVSVAGSAFFFAEDATNGRELWVSDGTEGGTRLVEDVTPGIASIAVEWLVASDDGVFFIVDGTNLWFSDGTEAGTSALASVSGVRAMVGASNGAYLITPDNELIFSDGTAVGTGELESAPASYPPSFTTLGSRVAFRGFEDLTGGEPWISDGTEAGTKMMADVAASPFAGPSWMLPAGNDVFFGSGVDLYASDGTAAGTMRVGELAPTWSSQPVAAVLGGTLLFYGWQPDAAGLWRSDGSPAGTSLVKAFREITQIHAGDDFALVVGGEVDRWEVPYAIWRTDGTLGGTHKLVETVSEDFVEFGGRTYFLGQPKNYSAWAQLWITDGTSAATRIVTTGTFTALGTAGGVLYVTEERTGLGAELYRTDGTNVNVTLVKDIAPGTVSSAPSSFVAAGNLLFFTADDGVHGRELWRSDGTPAGTFLLKDIRPGTGSSNVTELVASGAFVYFLAEDDVNGRELWRSDGTPAGTIRLTLTSTIGSLAPFDARLMSSGYDSFRGHALWETDGTIAGTFAAFDLAAAARRLTLARDRMFFTTTDAKLWTLARAASRVSIAGGRLVEGDTGSAILQFTVKREGDISGVASVDYATQDLTATAGADYEAASGTLSFAAGESIGTIAVSVTGDTILEQSESFAVVLTGATGVTIVADRAFGFIEENDQRVALSIEHVASPSGSWDPRRLFRITNAGPSAANVTMRLSESPFAGGFSCDGKNPSVCRVGIVPAGQSIEFSVNRWEGYAEYDSSQIPGRTLTATVTAYEAESDLSDNTIVRMIDERGAISFPPYLVAGTTATANVSAMSYFPSTLSLSVSGGVVVSPSSVTVTEANPVASLTLTVAENAWGRATVRNGSYSIMTVPIVIAGETVKLDTTFVVPDGYYDYDFDHDEPVVLPIVVAATLPDGTRPSGVVELRRTDNTLVASEVLDVEGAATFTLNDLPVGPHQFRLVYGGDASFNESSILLETVNVSGWWTSTSVHFVTRPCGDSDIVATVSNADGHTPTGSVKFMVGSIVIATVALVPGTSPNTATATTKYSFMNSWTSVQVIYLPDDPFEGSSDYDYASPGSCPSPTLIASASGTTSVSLIWSDVGANQYGILRSEAPAGGGFHEIGSTTATSFVDPTALAGKAYLYRVEARTSTGVVRSTSSSDLAMTFQFADDPIVFKATPVKALHIAQLQEAANVMRSLAGLSATTFDPVTAGSPIGTTEILVLRNAIAEGLFVLGQTTPTWIEGVSGGSIVKGTHVQQLRNVMK